MACWMVFILAVTLSHVPVASAGFGGSPKRDRTALVIIDVQNCFTPGGTLVVPGGDEVIPVINDMRKRLPSLFDVTVLSQDWHCPKHVSFASQHPGYSVYDAIDLNYNSEGQLCRDKNVAMDYSVSCSGMPTSPLPQILWPDHCVANTTGAEFHPSLDVRTTDFIVRKATKCQLDSYSAFYDNGRFGITPLDRFLKDQNVTDIYITGLALDYCVHWTAKDGKELGYNTYAVLDAIGAFDKKRIPEVVADMKKRGIHLVNSTDLREPEEHVMSRADVSAPAVWTVFVVIASSALKVQCHEA